MYNDVAEGQITVGEAVIHFELPTPLFLAISKKLKEPKKPKLYTYHSEAVISLLRSMLDDNELPPTHRQLAYARNISAVLDIPLTNEILTSSEACSNYLEKYSDQYQDFKDKNSILYKKNKTLITQAKKVKRWSEASQLRILGASDEELAELFGVKVATIEKYQENLNKWTLLALSDNTYDIVMMLTDLMDDHEELLKYHYIDLNELLKTKKDFSTK